MPNKRLPVKILPREHRRRRRQPLYAGIHRRIRLRLGVGVSRRQARDHRAAARNQPANQRQGAAAFAAQGYRIDEWQVLAEVHQ
jgi:hypothetical protein